MSLDRDRPDPSPTELRIKALKAVQPLGEIYLAALPFDVLGRITDFDVRRVLQEQRDVERYLGIQRPLRDSRVAELKKYVNFLDATFPTSVILAVDGEYAQYDESTGTLIIRNYRENEEPSRSMRYIARVLDGQHRIAGLAGFEGDRFDVPVVFFVGTDIAEQASIFSTVNLEQSKVGKSLAYDLFALAQTRSPQRVCHKIAVAFDRDPAGPFYHRIKRLGATTPGRYRETLSQATFVEALLDLITRDPKVDRDLLMRGHSLEPPDEGELSRRVFRAMFVETRDMEIAQSMDAFFRAVRDRWPDAWNAEGTGQVLNKTNGFRALMRLQRAFRTKFYGPLQVTKHEQALSFLQLSSIPDAQFVTGNYKPGSSGEGELFRDLALSCGIEL